MARPPGIKETKPRNTVARKMAALASDRGVTPLEVMLTAMREDWEAANAMLREQAPADVAEAEKWTSRIMKLRESAIATADRAAPYLHARLANTTMTAQVEVQTVDARAPIDALLSAAAAKSDDDQATRH